MQQTHLIVGLPKAGKTTFIAALWYVVETNRVPGALSLVELPESRKHLNDLRERWLDCLEQVHTTTSSEKTVRLKLSDPSNGRSLELVVPDLSGESFELQWSHRQCSRLYYDLANEAGAVLVFINPDHVNESATIAEEEALGSIVRETLGADKASTKHGAAASSDVETVWEPTLAPAQVKLVELLQFVSNLPFSVRQRRVAVIVSAWDQVRAENMTPSEWLHVRMPLLDQYLEANSDLFNVQVFGISAAGGRPDTEQERRSGGHSEETTRLQAHANQEERIEVLGTRSFGHDITAPIRLSMG